MSVTAIEFPNLGIYLANVPKNFTIFGYTIALYGCFIALGVLAGMLVAAHEAKITGQNPDIYWDFAMYAVVFSVIGARTYYVIFSWDYYKNNPADILNIRQGGGAIYGSVIAAFLTAFIYARIKKINFFTLVDTGVMGLIIGQVIGRWGNFTNREAFGQYTNSLFAMKLPVAAVRASDISDSIRAHMAAGVDYILVHPTFLYESMWNLCLFVALSFYRKHRRFKGENALLYLGGYGLGRFMIEGLRTDQLKLMGSNLAVSQCLAAALVLMAVIIEIIYSIRVKKEK